MDAYTVVAPNDPAQAERMRALRAGKKTVALVGMSPANCGLAPWEDESAEIWALNEMHAFPWCKRATRWFQLHPRSSFTREEAVRGVRGHYEWLKEQHGIPIYMQEQCDDIPDSARYPLDEIIDHFFRLVKKDIFAVSFFTSTFCYMMALAVYEQFERIEIYGFDMDGGFAHQREGAMLWLGVAMSRGIELYLPANSKLLEYQPLYAYEGQGGWNKVEPYQPKGKAG